MSPLSKLRSMSVREAWLVIQATVLLLSVSILLSLVGFSRTRRSCARVPSRLSIGDESAGPPSAMIARAVETGGSRLPIQPSCLAKAMTADALLDRHGYRSTLRIGVRGSNDSGIEGHAWVVHDGSVITGDIEGIDRYRPFESLGGL